MRFLGAITVVVFVTAHIGTGWKIPYHTPPGIYGVPVINGSETGDAILLASLTALKVTQPPALPGNGSANSKQSQDGWANPTCFDFEGKEDLDHASLDQATVWLDGFCGPAPGNAVNVGMNYYAISACVVTYFCHFPNQNKDDLLAVRCSSDDRAETTGWIDAKCGAWKPGQINNYRHDPATGYHVAYGRESYCTSWGHNFCDTGV